MLAARHARGMTPLRSTSPGQAGSIWQPSRRQGFGFAQMNAGAHPFDPQDFVLPVRCGFRAVLHLPLTPSSPQTANTGTPRWGFKYDSQAEHQAKLFSQDERQDLMRKPQARRQQAQPKAIRLRQGKESSGHILVTSDGKRRPLP